jgi:hypothetical protein
MQRVVARHGDGDLAAEASRDLDLNWLPRLGTILFWAAIALITTGLAIGLVALIRKTKRPRRQTPASENGSGEVSASLEPLPRSIERIDTLLETGPISEIPSMLYTHLVAYLTTEGVVQRGEYKTHRTLLRALAGDERASPVVARVGYAAERLTFGHGETSRQECIELRNAVVQLTGESNAE